MASIAILEQSAVQPSVETASNVFLFFPD